MPYVNGEWVEEDPNNPDQPATLGGGTAVLPETTPAPEPDTLAPAPSSAPPDATGTPLPSGAVPPPPPPPPPSPLNQPIQDTALNWLSTPNPYLSDLATKQRAAGEANLKQGEREAGLSLDENLAQRNLLGSSVEENARLRLQDQVQRQRQTNEAQLLEMLTNAESLGRQNAGNFALAARAGTADIDLRAQELRQQAAQAGRTLDLQEARDLATKELEQAKLSQQGTQFQSELSQRESEFARTYGLDEKQFTAQQEQFTKTYGEQVATRLQQDEQFKSTLASQNTRDAVDAGLRSRALDLQKQGLDADTAYKQAALEQENTLRTRALDLEQQGLNKDDAYRYAALEQDSTFKRESLRLQELGLNQEDSFRYAELKQQQGQFESELAFKLQTAKTEQERFDTTMKLWNDYFGPTITDAEIDNGYTAATQGDQPDYFRRLQRAANTGNKKAQDAVKDLLARGLYGGQKAAPYL